ncbi:MAG: MutS-related protein [Candidatus Limivicinus sp.]|jgi:DNA mismatch repair ATPase MutS
MRAGLLYQDAEPVWSEKPDARWDERFADLELEHILKAMSGGNNEIYSVCRQLLDRPLQSGEEIIFRQDILRDCIARPGLIRRLYRICQEAEGKRRGSWYRLSSRYLSSIYSSAAYLLNIYMEALVEIRRAVENVKFSSEGLRRFSSTLSRELSEEYLDEVRSLESGLDQSDGILISAGFGSFLQGISYVKRQQDRGFARLRWLTLPSYTVAERDMAGAADLGARRDRAINEVANAMAQAADSLESFTEQLRKELAFYVGALNLRDRLEKLGLPHSFPVPDRDGKQLWRELCDCSLGLLKGGEVVGNTLEMGGKKLCLITGANQGGKTTFLRSIGQCQLMAQCGLFVCAESCVFPVKRCIYTHFKREEDAEMDSGKLDEELGRMSGIIDGMVPGGMLLSNESFASTNDPEGSEILSQITRALLERDVEMFTVTHLINYAMKFAELPETLCLRADRRENGKRSFRLILGKPLKTAFGEDIFKKIFSASEETQ